MCNAVVSMAFGEAYQQLADLTFPTIRRYAERCGADFVVLGRREYEHIHYEKFQLYRLLGAYSRVPTDKFAAYDESGNHHGNCPGFLAEVAGLLQRPTPACPYYFNLGVHLQSRLHRQLFAPPERIMPGAFPEQNHLNYRIQEQRVPVCLLGCEWNCMADQQAGRDYWRESFFIHHSFQSVPDKVRKLTADLARWRAGDYLPHGKTG